MKAYRKFYFTSLCLFLVSAPQALNPPGVRAAKAEKKQDDKLTLFLTQAKLAYERRSPVSFMQLVDNSYSGRFDFEANLLQRFSSCKEITITFSIDYVFTGIKQMSVWLRWYRKGKDATDRLNMENGTAQFLLIDRVEGYKLVQINGDNPFF